MNAIAIPPLSDEQRALGRLAYIISQDPPAYQAAMYLPIRQLEARLAAEATTPDKHESQFSSMLDRWGRDVAAARESSNKEFQPSARMPRDTGWRRLKTRVADYFARPF